MIRRYTRRLALALGILLILAVPVGTQNMSTQIQIAINQLTTGVTPFTRIRLGLSDYINWGSGTDAAGYGVRDNSGVIEVKNSGGSWTAVTGGTGNPIDASYWTRVPEASLTNETPLNALATALLLNTTGTGVPVAYAGTSCTNQFVRSLDLVGAATCATVALGADVSGTLPIARGGTGLTAGTSGGIPAYTAAGTLSSSAALTANVLMLGGGAGAAPFSLAAGLGTTVTLLHGNAAGAPTWGAVSMTADVSGILPTGNGGTGNAFFALSGPAASIKTYTLPNASTTILTTNTAVSAVQGGTGLTSYTVGDLIHADSTTSFARLAAVATGNVLLSGGVGTISAWGKVGLSTHVTGTLAATNGGTGLASYTTGDVLYASSGTTIAGRAAVATGQVLTSAGVTTAPAYSATPRVTSIYLGAAPPGTPLAGSIAMVGVAFASLATPTNGTFVYCTDCNKATPCSGGGMGALAKRLAGAWDCD